MLVRPAPIRLLAWLSAQEQTVAGLGRADSRADLAERARAGDPEAFEQLVRAAGDRLLAVAAQDSRDPDAAEDALQQTVITAWRLLLRLREPDRFDAWLELDLVTSCYAEANSASALLVPGSAWSRSNPPKATWSGTSPIATC